LLHPADLSRSRRALDAMLCVLNFLAASPQADLLLLSAMMKNATEIASWLQDITHRRCIALNLTWKPTRQVRGCVVYDATEVQKLRAHLQVSKRKAKTKGPSSKLKLETGVRPHGFFCLHQTWQTAARKDYSLLPLLESNVLLGVAIADVGDWYLTANGNQVAGTLGAATAKLGLKTLIFVQTIIHCDSAAKSLSVKIGSRSIQLSEEELRLVDSAIMELGARSHTYLSFTANGLVNSACLPHHSLLLPAERRLHESLFRRVDGVDVLVATSTLAQGMNLPSEVVIISGDQRFEASANRVERLEAHELLNAAGRAGRAGEDSHGFVLIVPSKIIDFDPSRNRIAKHWMELKAIFAQSDQCLDIEDPIAPLLDEIHAASASPSEATQYLLTRLPHDPNEAPPGTRASTFLRSSFGVYRARARGDQDWVEKRISAAIALRNARIDKTQSIPWVDALAASVGLPGALIQDLSAALEGIEIFDSRDIKFWTEWLLAWLSNHPESIPAFVRRESLETFAGTPYRLLETDKDRGAFVLPLIQQLLKMWVQGEPLSEMEKAAGTPAHKLGVCRKARQFVLRIVPDLGYFFGLPIQILSARLGEAAEDVSPGLGLSTLGSCIREGFDAAEKLALRQLMRDASSRVAVHRRFAEIKNYLTSAPSVEDFAMAIERVKAALEAAKIVEG